MPENLSAIPMSMSPEPGAAATPQYIHPQVPVDANAAQANAYRMQDMKEQSKQDYMSRQEDEDLKGKLDTYHKSGGELVTPEDMQKAYDELSPQLSATQSLKLQGAVAESRSKELALKTDMMKFTGQQHVEFETKMDHAAQLMSGPLDAYGAAIEGGQDRTKALGEFYTAKQSVREMSKQMGDPMTDKEFKQFDDMSPEQLRSVVAGTTWHQKMNKEIADRKLESAKTEAELAKAAAELRKANTEARQHMSEKTFKVDGEPTVLNYDLNTGKYYKGKEEIDGSRITPLEKGSLTAVQMGTVEKDIFEAKKFLERTPVSGSASAFFSDQHPDTGFAKRWSQNKLTPEEYQEYDLYANRLANSIVGMQSLGRYRGAVKSVDEARKMVPAPGDYPETVKAKRAYIEDFTRDSDDEISKLSGGRPRDKIMPKERITEPATPLKGSPSAVKQIKNDAEYEALPPGATYKDPNGKTRTKKLGAGPKHPPTPPGGPRGNEEEIKTALLSGKMTEEEAVAALQGTGQYA